MIGVGKADITPLFDVGLWGYGDLTQTVGGLESRLYARAFIVRSAEATVVFVNCDLGFISLALRTEVVRRTAERLGSAYPDGSICIAATHTHSAPGGYSEHAVYNLSQLGHSRRVFEVLCAGIVRAIERAHETLQPGTVRFAAGEVHDVGINRSPRPFGANPETSAPGVTDTDRRMPHLTFHSANGELLGLVNWFAVHGTSHDKRNRLISGDNKGYASAELERRYPPTLVAAFAQSNSGDVTPNTVATPDDRLVGEHASSRESCRAVGERQANEALRLLGGPSRILEGALGADLTYVDFDHHVVPAPFTSTGTPASIGPAIVGQNFMTGTKDGRGPAWFGDGELRHTFVARLVATVLARVKPEILARHAPKHNFVQSDKTRGWLPHVLPLQLLRLGELAIAAVPFELTTTAGRRLRAAIAAAVGLPDERVVLSCLANGYGSYVATPEEYDLQHYEGASTLFGREQLNALRHLYTELGSGTATSEPPPRPDGRLALPPLDRPTVAVVPRGRALGDVLTQPAGCHVPTERACATFLGAHPSNAEPGVSLLDIERRDGGGAWHRVYDDTHWSTILRWTRSRTGATRLTCVWEIPAETEPGDYRFVHHGGSGTAQFVGASLPFAVSAVPVSHPAAPRCAHPADEAELIGLIRHAGEAGLQVRIRGSGHSTGGAIHTDGPRHIDVMLDRFNKVVCWRDAERQVVVQAGCHLGIDPNDPLSTAATSLLRQLDTRGWALPDLGGVTHQSVAGFLMTGSAGGSLQHSVSACVIGLRLVDGLGKVHDLRPNPADPDDEHHNPFYAAGVSLGLLGVVTEVTLQCVERYDLIGANVTAPVDAAAVDLFGEGADGLLAHLERQPYTRLFWWHQQGVHMLQVWTARHVTPADAPVTHVNGTFRARILRQLPGGRPTQMAFGWLMAFANFGLRPVGWLRRRVVSLILRLAQPAGASPFWGPWFETLPMDDEMFYDILPCGFTEIFLPATLAPMVAQRLRSYFEGDEGFERTGTFATELYAGKRSPFWLSPAFGQDMVRVDLIEILRGRTRPETDFFPGLWELFADQDFRYHWGKHMAPPESPLGRSHLARVYPMLGAFLALRAQLDPNQVFVSSYWRRYFGIPAVAADTAHTAEAARVAS